MTEIFEVSDFMEQLNDVALEIAYESNTVPGETDEVKRLFKDAVEKIEEARVFLRVAKERMVGV